MLSSVECGALRSIGEKSFGPNVNRMLKHHHRRRRQQRVGVDLPASKSRSHFSRAFLAKGKFLVPRTAMATSLTEVTN